MNDDDDVKDDDVKCVSDARECVHGAHDDVGHVVLMPVVLAPVPVV